MHKSREAIVFHRITEYELIDFDGRWYRPRAYGEPQPDGGSGGWLVFFPLDGGPAIAVDRPETTQSTSDALITWAARLTRVYLEGALKRAVEVAEQPPIAAQLAAAEYEALADAERLEAVSAADRVSAAAAEEAATDARRDAERLREERLTTERALAATEETAATKEAIRHEQAARDARDVAAEAASRRRSADE
jgi:hypothetical protein